jgi:hypothetical protein
MIPFRDQHQAEAALSNTEWLACLRNNTELVRPQFGVVGIFLLILPRLAFTQL